MLGSNRPPYATPPEPSTTTGARTRAQSDAGRAASAAGVPGSDSRWDASVARPSSGSMNHLTTPPSPIPPARSRARSDAAHGRESPTGDLQGFCVGKPSTEADEQTIGDVFNFSVSVSRFRGMGQGYFAASVPVSAPSLGERDQKTAGFPFGSGSRASASGSARTSPLVSPHRDGPSGSGMAIGEMAWSGGLAGGEVNSARSRASSTASQQGLSLFSQRTIPDSAPHVCLDADEDGIYLRGWSPKENLATLASERQLILRKMCNSPTIVRQKIQGKSTYYYVDGQIGPIEMQIEILDQLVFPKLGNDPISLEESVRLCYQGNLFSSEEFDEKSLQLDIARACKTIKNAIALLTTGEDLTMSRACEAEDEVNVLFGGFDGAAAGSASAACPVPSTPGMSAKS